MFIRDSMMARLALLVGIGLVTAGNYAACAFKSGPNGGIYPDTPGTPGPGTLVSAHSPALSPCAMSPASRPTALSLANPSVSISRSSIGPTRSSAFSFPMRRPTISWSSNQVATQVVWMWSDGQAFAQVTTELVFEPYASKTFTLIWSGTLTDGTHLPRRQLPGPRRAGISDGFEGDPLRRERHVIAARAVHGALIIQGFPAPWRACASYRWRDTQTGARREIQPFARRPGLRRRPRPARGRACRRPRTEDSRFQPSAAQGRGLGGHDARRLPAAHRAQIRRRPTPTIQKQSPTASFLRRTSSRYASATSPSTQTTPTPRRMSTACANNSAVRAGVRWCRFTGTRSAGRRGCLREHGRRQGQRPGRDRQRAARIHHREHRRQHRYR